MSRSKSRLDYAERWLRDGLQVLRPPASVLQVNVDMTMALRRLDDHRQGGVSATPTHLIVQATAHALASIADLHQVIAGNRRERPAHVDIGLSVAGDSFVAPVLVIEGADAKTVDQIAAETAVRLAAVRQADQRMQSLLRQWGWIVPFGFLRRAILRVLFASPAFRRRGAGTFQVSMVPADAGFSTTFATAGVLFGGQVRSQAVVVDGRVVVRPMMTLTLSADHGVWDGRAAARLLAAVKTQLEKT